MGSLTRPLEYRGIGHCCLSLSRWTSIRHPISFALSLPHNYRHVSIGKLLLVFVVAHELGDSSMADCLKCQTFAASPAEPGGLPLMLGFGRKNHLFATIVEEWRITFR